MGRAEIALAAVAVFWSGQAWAAGAVPLPVPRPASASGAGQAVVTAAPKPTGPSACARRLSEVAVWAPPPPLTGGADCGSEDVLRLDAVIMPDRTRVAMEPPAVLRCSMAAEVVRWIRDDVGPAALRLGSPLAAVNNAASYTCRGRNGQRGAKISEHGRANALDVASVRLANRTVAAFTDPAVSRPFREAMRVSACGRFSTVLGPGSDGFHEHHVHVDLIQRARGMRMCQWDIRDQARPEIAVAETPPARETPARETPARKTPAKETAAKDATAKDSTAEDGGRRSAPVPAAAMVPKQTEAVPKQTGTAPTPPAPTARPKEPTVAAASPAEAADMPAPLAAVAAASASAALVQVRLPTPRPDALASDAVPAKPAAVRKRKTAPNRRPMPLFPFFRPFS